MEEGDEDGYVMLDHKEYARTTSIDGDASEYDQRKTLNEYG